MSSPALQLVQLTDLVIGEPATFLAYVHQHQQDKLKDKKHTTIWIGDRTIPFFKLHAWSNDAGAVSTRIDAGDIVCFQDVAVKSFRGSVEAHLVRYSTVTVLVRKNQFQNNHESVYVPFSRIVALVDWSKEIIGYGFGEVNVPMVRIRDLRENMLAHVVCRLRATKNHRYVHNIGGHSMTANDLQTVVMYDGVEDAMLLHIWNHHIEPHRLRYAVLLELRHLIVSFDSLRQCLVATTTAESTLHIVQEDIENHKMPILPSMKSNCHDDTLLQFDSFAEATEAVEFNGHAIFRNVVVEDLECPVDLSLGVAMLIECYCTYCECTLAEKNASVVPRVYASSCVNQCPLKIGWRYRPCTMHIRDSSGARLQIYVHDTAFMTLVGHVPADSLVHPKTNHDGMDAHFIVETLLRAVVSPVPVTMQIYCSYNTHQTTYAFVCMQL
jgi:hypothetical protein